MIDHLPAVEESFRQKAAIDRVEIIFSLIQMTNHVSNTKLRLTRNWKFKTVIHILIDKAISNERMMNVHF